MRTGVLALLLALAVAACGPQSTPLELQTLQQRELPAPKPTAFAATVSVFQDLGYIVDAADLDTGLITASSPASSRVQLFVGPVNTQTRATAFVETAGPTASRVRLNFITGNEHADGWGGRVKDDTPILDPAVYQSAFERIETAIFIR